MKLGLAPSRIQRQLERRLFLKALTLGLSLPVAYKLMRSATAQTTPTPKRFLLYYMPHGVPPEHFNPQGTGSTFSLAESGESILGPLEPYKQLVNVYQGFQYPGASTHEGIVKFLSNHKGANNDDTASRTSIEHYIANELGYQALALGAVAHRPFGQDFDAKLFWDGQPVVPEKNPLKAYDEVFAGLGAGAPETSTNDDLYQSLLSLTEAEIVALQGEVKSLTKEHTKLQTHLESIQSLKTTGGGAISCTSAPVLDAVESLREAAAGQSDEWFLKEENFPAILAAQLEIAAASLLCNARPVVGIQPLYANCEIDFGFMGSAGAHHSVLSHTGPQIGAGTANMEARAPFAKAQRWFIEQLVTHVIEKLDVDDPADPGRTVLENTTILFASEIGEGAWHLSASDEIMTGPPPGMLSYMPIVTIGGGGGALKTGQVLNYFTTKGNDREAGELWLTLAKAMGVNTSEFGGATSVVTEALA